jgi:hypothetical protein
MTYIRVRWLHENANDPIWLLSELDDNRWETRKLEIYADGSNGYATKDEESGGTMLGLMPVPVIGEIASDPLFHPEEITKEEFEAAWSTRTS